jgi:3-hydroxybutyryl-CoA dehydrogenase
MERLFVVGAGQMGAGIAQVAAEAGLEVFLLDANLDRAEAAKKKIHSGLQKLVEKGKRSGDAVQAAMAKIHPTAQYADGVNCQAFIEAASERLEIKLEIFRKFDEVAKPGALLATNTSSISITKIAAATKRPQDVVGMHFMNPVPVMKLVEGIRGLRTSEQAFNQMKLLAEKMGKTVVVAKDFPGFAVNRILMPMINEAIYALYEGVAGVEDIDSAMKLGTNQPMGPLTLADFIGLDTCLAIMNVLHEGLGDGKYRPCPLLRNYVEAGMLGKKTSLGFYDYRGPEPKPFSPEAGQ